MGNDTSLNHINEENEKWEFDEKVTVCFEDMLERSIPQYDVMRKAVFNLGCKFITKASPKIPAILEIGCSNGLQLEPFVHKYGAHARFIGCDVSKPMLEEAVERFKGYIKTNIVRIEEKDIRKGIPQDLYQLVISTLTIQFTPIEYRQNIIQDIYNNLLSNGAFIMVEKVLGNCAELNEIMVEEYLTLKEGNGYSREQIERKKAALEGVLVPCTSNWNIDLLKQAGFRKVDVFWRWMNFEGYICIK